MYYKLFIACMLIIFVTQLAGIMGCAKEYSFEGRPDSVADTIPAPDPTTPLLKFPACMACRNLSDTQVLKWSFNYDTSLLCGNITNAVISADRTAFTFFGPSTCSNDTGIIITVYLTAATLDKDCKNITGNNVFFKYYDNVSQSDIFLSVLNAFTLTIENYEHATGIAKGTFGGNVNRRDGTVEVIKGGKFLIWFK